VRLMKNPAMYFLSFVAAWMAVCPVQRAFGLGERHMVAVHAEPGSFVMAEPGKTAPLLVDKSDWPGVLHAVDGFRGDLAQVTGRESQALDALPAHASDVILVGTLGHSALIDGLARERKIDADSIRGKWEAGLVAVVRDPAPGIERALVVAGSDKRGTIFALYTLSEQIGVSPWAWWADVRVPHRDSLYVLAGSHSIGSPVVRYRGIFLNDEEPALGGWAREKFGGLNHKFYTHVFELLLRLRANYLWPAMWNGNFNEDDPLNPKLADEYGIVMGTSHHEAMLRSQQEWKRHGHGAWDYQSNSGELRRFWTEGIARNKNYESTLTVGMRGDGDMAMSESVNTALLEQIVADQRKIIAANGDPEHPAPQIWALYKEVQEYYEKGMRVPEDVTLLWSDDNWGNLRRLPTKAERERPGGAGIYYHFDYVGGPRSYKWLNDISITKVWEQMHLAIAYDATRVWIVNVGDLKPMEFPIEFFLTMARDPDRWGKDDLEAYTEAWAEREFGSEHARQIASLLDRYTRYNARRKPEMLTPTTYSLTEGHEADRVEREWAALAGEADRLVEMLPTDERASYFELVQYPIDACANLGAMYVAAGRNRLYARQGRASANFWAAETLLRFQRDAALSQNYNHLLNGKWNHMMDQTHIGYTAWNDPPVNVMPEVVPVKVPAVHRLGVFPEGDGNELLAFDAVNRQRRTIELAPLGSLSEAVRLSANAAWVLLSVRQATLTKDTTVQVQIDWAHVPTLPARAEVKIEAEGQPVTTVRLQVQAIPAGARGFVEDAGVVAINADHVSRNRESAGGLRWENLPGFAPMGAGIEAFPVTAPSTTPEDAQACVEYDFTLLTEGNWTAQAILAPTLPFQPSHGLRYSMQLDGGRVQTVDAWARWSDKVWADREWSKAVSDGVHRVDTSLGKVPVGSHTLRLCRVDAGVALERLLIFRNAPLEYLGPVESKRVMPTEPLR